MLSIFQSIFENFFFLILYISGGSSFPKPLSVSEEEYYLHEYWNGNLKARDILIERNLRLVAHVVKKYYAANQDQEDLISIGTIGLIKAVTSFKAGRGTRLATYAARCIENEILMQFRSNKKIQNEVHFSDPVDSDKDGNTLTFMDIVFQPDDILDNIDKKANARRLYACLETLPTREKTIIIMRYGLYDTKPKTQRQVAKKLSISRSYVSRIEKKALEHLKQAFECEIKS